jgi:hypothetical protein
MTRPNKSHRVVIFVALVACAAFTSACASAIYASGKHGDVLRKGTDRQMIVERLGEPIERSVDKC